MLAELRAAWAVARKDLRVVRRYPISALNNVFPPLYQFLLPRLLLGATFLVGGRAVGLEATAGTDDIAGFLFLGSVIAGLVGAVFWGTAFSFKTEIDAGTLEPSWLTPTSRETFVIGRALGSLIVAGVAEGILLVTAVVVFGAQFSPAVLLALPAVAVAAVGLVGIGYLVSSGVLLLKEPSFLVDSTDFLVVSASGVAFPLAILPGPALAATMLLPTTHALDLLRAYALGTRPLLPDPLAWLALVAASLVAVVVGRWVFLRTDRRLRVSGSLRQH
jgi:ABC-2 type transport system permease protein